MTINKNDDVTVSGIVIGVEGNNVLLELNKGSRIWVEKEEIKTIRHNRKDAEN